MTAFNPHTKRILSLILIISLLFSLAACGQKATATWQEQYDLGVRYLNEGKYEEAIIAFNAAIEIDPKQADAYIGLASTYAAQGNTEKALEILEKAVDEIGETADLTAALNGLLTPGGGSIDDGSNIHLEPPSGGGVSAVIVGGTLDIRDLQASFLPGADEYAPDCVGYVEYAFTVYGPENTRNVLIGTWSTDGFRQDEIPERVDRMTEMWRDYGMSIRGYESLPAKTRCAGPIYPHALDVELDTLLIGIDKDGNATGYAIIRQIISSDGSMAGGFDSPVVPTGSSDLPSIDELTFFGETLTCLTASEMESSAAANGWYTSNNSAWDDGEDYYWFQASPSAFGGSVSAIHYDNDPYWSFISYDHYIDFADEPSIPIGLRDIYTLDSTETVFTKMGIAGAEDIAREISAICAEYPYEEALGKLQEYSNSLHIRNDANGTNFYIGGGGSGAADENGIYWVESFFANFSFYTEDYMYGLDFEFTNGFLTLVMINRAPTY